MKAWPVFFGIGIIGLLGYFLIAVIGVGYLAGFGPEDYSQDQKVASGQMLLLFCTPILLVPSLIFFYFGWRGRARHEQLKDVADILKAYRRIKLSELGSRLGKTEREAEKLILECLEEKLIHGYIDPSKRVFLTSDYAYQYSSSKVSWRCEGCGTFNESFNLPGEHAKCSHCGRYYSTQSRARTKRTDRRTRIGQRDLTPRSIESAYGHICPKCGSPMTYLSELDRWMCEKCTDLFT